jgi:hypothetical protein
MEDNILHGFEKALSDIQDELKMRELLDDESELWLRTKGIVARQRSELMRRLTALHNKRRLTRQEQAEKLVLTIREEQKYLALLITTLGVSITDIQERLMDIEKQLK